MAALVTFRFAQEGLELLLPYIGQRIAVLEEGVGAAACCKHPQELVFHLDTSQYQMGEKFYFTLAQKPTHAAVANMESASLQDVADTRRLLNQRDSATAQLVSKGKEVLETLGPGLPEKRLKPSFVKTSWCHFAGLSCLWKSWFWMSSGGGCVLLLGTMIEGSLMKFEVDVLSLLSTAR